MIFYDGTYRLQRKEDRTREEAACTWRLRLINMRWSQPDVAYLRPIVVVATREGGLFKTTCADSLGRRIFRDFSLNVQETLWIEHFPDEENAMYVATFTPMHYFGTEPFYSIDWRPIRPNEMEAIRRFLPEVEADTP